jgi:hypothetical protein
MPATSTSLEAHTATLANDLTRALLHRRITVAFTDHGHKADASIGDEHSIGTGDTPREALAVAVAGLSA